MRDQSLLAAVLFAAVTPLLVIPEQTDASDKMIYWNDGSSIGRTNLDGTGSQQLVSVGYGNWGDGLAIDSKSGKMYWSEYDNVTYIGKIRRSNLDGSMAEDILTGLTTPLDISLDVTKGGMYWMEYSDGPVLKSSNLDGSNYHSVYKFNSDDFHRYALNFPADKIYWAEYESIRRSNLDGSQVETVVNDSGGQQVTDLVLDDRVGKIYWSMEFSSYLGCSNLDGSDLRYIQTGIYFNYSVSLDPDIGKIYWSGGQLFSSPCICRANLDGSGIESVLSLDNGPAVALAIGPVPEPASLFLLALGALIAIKSR